jgi:transaldolase
MGIGALKGRAVFLDRDGVINRAFVRDGKPYPPADIAQLEVPPGVPEALARLRAAGYRLIVVTNQPDVARGAQTHGGIEALHTELLARGLNVDEFRVCYHDDADGCDCRKPKPGLLLAAAREEDLDLTSSYLVGDRWRDIEAGKRAGCTTVFIDYGYAEGERSQPHARVRSLLEAADWILRHTDQKTETGDMDINELKVKIFADGADKAGMLEMYRKPYIKGFTTNPTLMRKAGIADYKAFALDIVQAIPDRPLSLEVFADEFDEMERQAREIATWGRQVYVKIPITNSRGKPAYDLVRRLSHSGVKLNVTAIMPLYQVRAVADCVAGGAPCFVSVFAGRIADTGRDPVPLMATAVEMLRPTPNAELIWASPRELLNIFQADAIGCHVITMTNDLLKKIPMLGKDLAEYSLDTVRMFYGDARTAGYEL